MNMSNMQALTKPKALRARKLGNGRLAIAASLGLVMGGAALLAAPAHADSQDSTAAKAEQYVSDTAITAKVKAALVANDSVKGLDTQVETQNGVVQLSGFVDTETQADLAVEVAKQQKGVKDVKNDLRLKSDTE